MQLSALNPSALALRGLVLSLLASNFAECYVLNPQPLSHSALSPSATSPLVHQGLRGSLGVRGLSARAEAPSGEGLSDQGLSMEGLSVEGLRRRGFMASALSALLLAGFPQPSAAKSSGLDRLSELEAAAPNAQGLKILETKAGVDYTPKAGDTVRVALTLTLKDGTPVTRQDDVQRKVPLGEPSFEFPKGLVAAIDGMKLGSQRLALIPPELGWTSDYRVGAVQYLRGCSGSSCPLDTQPVVANIKLLGYEKAECKEGDMPVSMDASELTKSGKVYFKFGSEICPEGNVEVTAERLKTKALIKGLRESGKFADKL